MVHMTRNISFAIVSVVLSLVLSLPVSAITLEKVKERDHLLCGVSTELTGFSRTDEQGNWHGLNVDICRAVAAAVLGDADKVKFVSLTDKNRMATLQSGDVDLLSMNTPWSLSYDSLIGLNFTGVTFYDGQGFMVPVKLGVTSGLELQRVNICLEYKTMGAANLGEYFKANGLVYKLVELDEAAYPIQAFEAGKCDVLSGDISSLYARKMDLAEPDDYKVLPEIISIKPLGPVVRQGDAGWFNIVKWTVFTLVIAEDNGITSDIIDTLKDSENLEVRRFLGLEGVKGKGLGLADDWAYQVIKQVGNYGELFEHNLGQSSELKMDRNLNELWNRGGLHFGPSFE